MNRPSISQVQAWRPDALRELADVWESAAARLDEDGSGLLAPVDGTAGATADSARDRLAASADAAQQVSRALVAAAAAARAGAPRIAAARDRVLDCIAEARADGSTVADDGTVSPAAQADGLLRLLSGSDDVAARALLATQAAGLTASITAALDALAAMDAEVAQSIDAGFSCAETAPAPTRPAGAWPVEGTDVVAAWPVTSQDRIAGQIAAMTPEQRAHLVTSMPHQIGNTDGVPWDMRVAANRINIADAILTARHALDVPVEAKVRAVLAAGIGTAGAERMWPATAANPVTRAAAVIQYDRDITQRMAFYQDLLADVPDPTRRTDTLVPRQILAFDPARASLVELTGDLRTATSVGVLVPGLNTTVTGSAANDEDSRRFVAAGGGRVAMITYLGGPFPTGELAAGLLDAADPRYALDMAPRLVAFSEDVNRTVDATGRAIPVTYIGHSYGGSILGTAERLGLTADRTLYVEAAGAGVGVHDPGDWHNRNPDVLRFTMTAPGDPIELVQGFPTGPHGADPDDLPGVIRLDTGRRLDGTLMSGLAAHSDVFDEPSDAWRNMLGVITGDRELLKVYRSAG